MINQVSFPFQPAPRRKYTGKIIFGVVAVSFFTWATWRSQLAAKKEKEAADAANQKKSNSKPV